MSGVNKVIQLGRLGADPELEYTSGGHAVARFNVATSRKWKDRETGEWREATQWTRVVVWRKLAERCRENLVKGQRVYVEGRLETTSWEDRDGNRRWKTEVVAENVQFLDRPKPKSSEAPPEPDFGDDDIPF
jgi:single-strand DNA-binding protein